MPTSVYLKEIKLKDGSEVTLRLIGRDDLALSLDFFRRLPAEERLYLRRDTTRREIIDERIKEIENGLATGIVAIADGKIVGDALLFVVPHGWYRKTGEMRLIVDTDYRGKGLGSVLAREIFILAVKKDLRKLEACIMETQAGAKRMMEKLGFVQDGVLSGFVVDLKGREHDLILMGMRL